MSATSPHSSPESHFTPLAEVTRGGLVESVHSGAVAVVDSSGRLIYSAGDPDVTVFTRSSLKPFQAIPFVARGGHVRYGLTAPEIALLCASHSGEPRHEEAVRSILAKSGRSESELLCGTHPPIFYSLNGRLPRAGEVFTPAQHNCSGKHAGMLAFCTLTGSSPANYIDPQHPIQQAIRRAVAEFAGLPEDRLGIGVDGCSAPNFALPLAALARAFARLAEDRDFPEYGDAPRTIFAAMTAHPEYVSGEKRNDLAIMQTGGGDWVSKVGAEAVQGIGIRSRGWGIAIKIADGNPRALHPVTVEVLRQLGLLEHPEGTPLAPFQHPAIKNYREIETGVVRPTFRLNTHAVEATASK
jgi:L-asparaginase II